MSQGGSITSPDELGPLIDDEMRIVKRLKDAGTIRAIYRRAAGPGVLLLLEGESIHAIRERIETLPFVIERLMTVEYEEIYEI